MLGYYCPDCEMHYQELETRIKPTGHHCPECGGLCKPRLILGGMVMGAPSEERARK